jgi:hypothetical protein
MSEENIPILPPDGEALFTDPRLEGLTDPLPGFPPSERLLEPTDPAQVGDSEFLIMRSISESRGGRVTWVNKPEGRAYADQGNGRGFWLFKDPPVFQEACKKPKQPADFWPYLGWFIASPKMVEILSRFDPSVIDTVAIDWTFSDGKKLDGYVFLDLRRRIHAYDYRRTAVLMARDRGHTFIHRFMYPRTLKPIPDPKVNIFREAYSREVFVKRELAKELSLAGIKGNFFEDPAAIGTVQFT